MTRISRLSLRAMWMAVVTALATGTTLAAEPSIEQVRHRLKSGQATRIVCFGDSITGAYYHTGGVRAWCDMLGLALQQAYPSANIEMINAGISGHTTVNALARIENDVLARQPQLVVVMFGMNDVTRVPLDEFRANTRTIANRCLESGAAVVLCTPNSVYDNAARPNDRLAQFSQAVRDVATELNLPLVDCFAEWQQLRDDDPTRWMLMMSDAIHPNMNGHRHFAEIMAKTIAGQAVSLDGASPLGDALHHTFDQLRAQKSVKLIASAPYDELFPAALREHFPDAQFELVNWPASNQTLAEISEWAKQIRGLQPDLVVAAIPADVQSPNKESFIRDYEWVLNWSFQFAGRPWDVVPVLPSVAGVVPAESQTFAELARQIAIGKDVRFIDRAADDARSDREIVNAWVAEQHRIWQEARGEQPNLR